jgi:hypothetical protein
MRELFRNTKNKYRKLRKSTIKMWIVGRLSWKASDVVLTGRRKSSLKNLMINSACNRKKEKRK